MVLYDKTFDPKVDQGDCDLSSWLIDFALYRDTQLIYFHTSFRVCMNMTRPLTQTYLKVTMT